MVGYVKEWLSARWPFSALYKVALEEEIPGGASFCYSFGSAILIVFSIQAATGVMQLFYYVPSVRDAYRSVSYLQTKVPFGWLIHGLHYWGAQAMVVLVLLHVVRVFLWGAYKRPRELTWLAGVVLLLIVMTFSLTGTTLPWDQKGYWVGQVSTSIAGVIPVVGEVQKILLRGGEDMGQLTITRFFGIHVGLLPLALVAVFGFHIVAMRRFGNAGPWDEERRRRTGAFWPDQVLKDAIVGTVIFFILITLVVFAPYEFHGATDRLDTSYVPKPEWNFLFLYESLKYFQGPLEPIGAAGVPGLLVALFVLLPFIDRSPERNPFRRPWVIASGFLFAGVLTALTIAGYLSPGYGTAGATQAGLSNAAGSLKGVMTEGGGAATVSPPLPSPQDGGDARATGKAAIIIGDPDKGKRLFKRVCKECHGPKGRRGSSNIGSALGHVPVLNPIDPEFKSSDPGTFAKNIDRFIRHGSRPEGPSPSVSMPSFKDGLSEKQRADIISYVMQLNGVNRAARAQGSEGEELAKSAQETDEPGKTVEGAVSGTGEEPARQGKGKSTPPVEESASGQEGPPLPSPPGGASPGEVSEAAFIIGSSRRGEVLFNNTCARCHGEAGKGGHPNYGSEDGTVPELNPIDPAFLSRDPEEFATNVDRFIQHGSVPGGTPSVSMPAFGDSNALTQQQMANVIAYIMLLNGADRAEILNPGMEPWKFYVLAAGGLVLTGLALAGAWSRKSNRPTRESSEKENGSGTSGN